MPGLRCLVLGSCALPVPTQGSVAPLMLCPGHQHPALASPSPSSPPVLAAELRARSPWHPTVEPRFIPVTGSGVF